MKRKFYFSPIAPCLLTLSTIASAAQPILLPETTFTAVQRDFNLMFPNMKKSLVGKTNTLNSLNQHIDTNKMTHVRMQQHYAGYPVFRGYAIIHTKQSAKSLLGSGNEATMSGVVYKGLEAELGVPDASFAQNGANALKKFTESYSNDQITQSQVVPMVYIDEAHHAYWAYKVSVLVQKDSEIPQRPMAILNAQTLEPFVQWNDIKTVREPVKGEGFGGNMRTSKVHFDKELHYLEISRDKTSGICYMENSEVKVVNMGHGYETPNRAMSFNCQASFPADPIPNGSIYWTGYKADGYDRNNGAYAPTNDALYAGYIINQMYKKWYGIPPLTRGDKPKQLIMRVHYGTAYENAFWDGEQMTFGDGDHMMHPLVSLGVGAHEISHGFTEQHSNLMYFGQSGGMNESFSDMASQAAEYFAKQSSSWSIGADILKKTSGYNALRFMDKPSKDGSSIDTADEYHEGMDVHNSSGVYNHLFYLLATKPDWTTRKAFNVMLKANMDYWTPYTSFEEGSCGVINAALDLGYDVAVVKEAFDEVAIHYQHCEQTSNPVVS